MKHILVESYPNREIRFTLTRQQTSASWTYETEEEIEAIAETLSPLTCHSLKTRVPPTKPHKSGGLHSQEKPGWGVLSHFRKFSGYGRKMILRAGGALEDKHPHNECLFLTLTHPGSTKESFEALAKYSGKAVKLLHDWLSNHISSKLSIYTWEWQKRGALHLHYVVHCPDAERGEWIIKNLQKQWIRILEAIGKASQTDLFKKHKGFSWASNKEIVRVDAQWCEKSVAAYLSKYVSKAGMDNFSMPKNAHCPSRWYGVSRPLLALMRSLSFKVALDYVKDGDAWGMYEDFLSVLQSWGLKCYSYKHEVGSGKTVVGYVNRNEQDSIWTTIMTQICPNQDSLSNTEMNLRRLTRNGIILIRKHRTWLSTFMQFYGTSRPGNLLNSTSFKDISRSDLIFLLDSLAYSFRYHQRTRFELPGECKLWYSTTKSCLENAPTEDKDWIGYLQM